MKYSLFFVCALLFVSCGKFSRIEDGGFTTVTFTAPQSPGAAVMASGILVYAYSQNYVTNFKIATDAEMAGKQVVLPNGQYSFYAFGYDNGSAPFSANVKCAV